MNELERVSRSLPLVALSLLCGCSTTQKPEHDHLSAEQLVPLRELPQDGAVYARFTVPGWQRARVALGELLEQQARDPDLFDAGVNLSLTGPGLLIELQSVLDSAPAETGLDVARPVFVSFLSVDAAKLEHVVALAGFVEPDDLPTGLLTTVLLPAADANKLAARLESWWSSHVLGTGFRHRVAVRDGWVRLDVFGGTSAEGPADAAMTRALERSRTKPLRMTHALAEWLTRPADLSLYFPLDRARPFAAFVNAANVYAALNLVNPADKEVILAAGATELADQWLVMDPTGAEIEDLAASLYVTPGSSLQVHAVMSLTALGRSFAARPPIERLLPRFKESASLLDLRLVSSSPPDVPLPAIGPIVTEPPAETGERAELLDRHIGVAGSWAFLSMARAPRAWLRLLQEAEPAVSAGLEVDAVQLRLLGGTTRRQRFRPQLGAVLAFRDSKRADEFVLHARARGPLYQRNATVERLAALPDGGAPVYVGIGVSPDVLLDGTSDGAAATGFEASFGKELWRLLAGRRVQLPYVLSANQTRLTIETDGTVARATLGVGGPLQKVPAAAATRAFEPVSYVAPGSCEMAIREATRRATNWLAEIAPADTFEQVLSRVESAAACAAPGSELATRAAEIKERTRAVHRRTEPFRERMQQPAQPGVEGENRDGEATP